MKEATVLALFVALLILPIASAIPESDSDSFRMSARAEVQLDSYYTGGFLQSLTLNTYSGSSSSYYFIVRKSSADVLPYDDFEVCFTCSGDYLETCVRTTDYDSWVENGQISFLRSDYLEKNVTFGGSGVNRSVDYSTCYVSGNDASYDGNGAWSSFYVEMVPRLSSSFSTITSLCEYQATDELIDEELSGIYTVVSTNVNFFYTIYLIFTILAVLGLVFGVPLLIFLIIKWAIYKVTGHKILERSI